MPKADLAVRILARLALALVPPPDSLIPLRIEGRVAGRLTAERTERLEAFAATFRRDRDGSLSFAPGLDAPAARTAALAEVTHALARERALSAWRDERYAVAPTFGAPPWFHLERAAARYFGVRTHAAHVNGLVRSGAEPSMWVARRSPTKAIDPDMLDNLVGGGIAAGAGVARTVLEESWEEAGIPSSLASRAQPTGMLHIERLLPDGLQDEVVFVHDLWLTESFVPANQDGEAVEHRRLPLDGIAGLLDRSEGRDAMTLDASLVALTVLARINCPAEAASAQLGALVRKLSWAP